MKHIAKHNH